MTLQAVLIVLTAAVLHALWNAVVKGAPDKAVVLGLVALGHAVPALIALPFIGLPVWAAFPFIIGSTLIHWGYYWFLNTAYKHGDLSVVYPISRGMTPIWSRWVPFFSRVSFCRRSRGSALSASRLGLGACP